MTEECIHGFEPRLCDMCSPKKPPVGIDGAPLLPPKRTRTTRRAGAPRAGQASEAKLVDVRTERIYHVTHIDNLPSIIAAGRLYADATAPEGSGPVVDISSAENRAARRGTTVAGPDSESVATFVPFFLSLDAHVWNSVRARLADPRIAPDATHYPANDFAVLVTCLADVSVNPSGGEFLPDDVARLVVADGDPTDDLTRVAATAESAERMLRKLRLTDDGEAARDAELLVAGDVPLGAVSVIGVATVTARERVKQMFAESDLAVKVAAYPPWFLPTP